MGLMKPTASGYVCRDCLWDGRKRVADVLLDGSKRGAILLKGFSS